MNQCFCHSNKQYKKCCQPFLEGHQHPSTPEQLMRSRYSAYATINIPYIQKTMKGAALAQFDFMSSEQLARNTTWINLKIVSKSLHHTDPNIGYIEFIATYQEQGQIRTLHENSRFEKTDGSWYYVDGDLKPNG